MVVSEIGVRSLVLKVTEPIAILAGEFRHEGFKAGLPIRSFLQRPGPGAIRSLPAIPIFRNLADAFFLG